MIATYSDSETRTLRVRLRAVTWGRLVAAAALVIALSTAGAPLIDPAARPLLVVAAVVHLGVNLLVLVLPERPVVQRAALDVTTVVDAGAISVLLVATGAVASPLVPLVYTEAVMLTLVFGWWTGVRAASLLSLGLVWTLSTSPLALSTSAGVAATGDPSLSAVLEPGTRAVFQLAALWAVTVLVATLNGVTERDLRAWLDDLALLRNVTRDLDPRQGVASVCEALADRVTGSLGYAGAAVWTVDRDRGHVLRSRSARGRVGGRRAPDGHPCEQLRSSDPQVSRALAAGRPHPVRRCDPRAEALERVHGQEAALVLVPLLVDGRLLGILSAEVATGRRRRPSLSGRDLRRLDLLVAEAALLLANATLQAELRDLSVTDALTGLPNHRFLQQRLGEEVERVVRRAGRGEDRPLSLALFDLDHFKAVNDTFGHPTGDEVLRAVARRTAEVLRNSDVACRYGGEEFAVVLVDTTGPEAVRACERIAGALRAMSLHAEDGRALGRITASFGIATTIGPGLDRAGLLARADRALYVAKRRGRDRVCHTDDLGPADVDTVAVEVRPHRSGASSRISR
jgi:two-component system, cell cycle response regulator